MIWEEFVELRDKLTDVCALLSINNARDSSSLKGLSRHSLYFFSTQNVLNQLSESDFLDLSYRYIASDEDLNLLSKEIDSFNL